MIKRMLVPTLFLSLIFPLAGPANAQVVSCSISSTGGAIGLVPALPGVTANASDTGHTEVGASAEHGVADMPGGGRVRISCTNTNAGGPPAAVSPGVVVLIVDFQVPITNSQTHPGTAAGIRLINGTGDFVTPGPLGPTAANPGNIGIAAIDHAAGKIVIGLGTPGSTVGSSTIAPVVPTSGITFTAGTSSTFELAGWLLSTNGRSGAINATLTSTGGVSVVPGTGNCAPAAGPCTQVIATVKPSLQDPTVPTGTLPALVTALPNLGSSPITGGSAIINSSGTVLKSNFTIRVRENYSDLFKSSSQFNTGAVFPASLGSGVQVNVAFSNIPPGFEISGCAAVLTDLNGAAPALPGGASVSTSVLTAASSVLTVFFTSPVDQVNVDVLWITCTKVGLGTATLPLPSTPVTAQLFLGPIGDALTSNSVLTGLTTGVIPRYSPPPATNAFSLISFGTSTTVTPSAPPATITATAGTPQSVEVGTLFNTLRVIVRDRFDNPVSGATVTFASDPTSNARVTFPRGDTALTDASGQAAIDARANFSIGSYTVTATSGAATLAIFGLTNTQRLTVAVPALLSGNADQLGIAWTNTSDTSITLKATARGYDGQLIAGNGVQNPAELTVRAGEQIARLAVEIFGPGITGRSGWVELTASAPGVNGFFQLFDKALSTSDGGSFPIAPSSRLVFPRVDRDTTLYIVNTGDQSTPATAVLLYDNDGTLAGGTTLSIGAKAGWSGHIADLLPSLQASDGYVVVDTQGSMFAPASETLVGMQSYQRGDSAIVLGQPDSDLVRSGYAVHVAIGAGYTTRVTLVNPASVQQEVQLTLNGTSVQRTIPAYGRLDESLAQMFNISSGSLTTGYLKLQTSDTPGVSGYIEIAASEGLVRTTTPIAREAQRRLMFSHIAQGGGYFTGLALLNTAAAAATVTIEVNSPNATILASKVVTLQAGERMIGLLSELFPNIQNQMGGFVRVVSSVPIYGLQIFGSINQRSANFLANIPAGTF